MLKVPSDPQKTTLYKLPKCEILMEGEVIKKKKQSIFNTQKTTYMMTLTNQPRLYVMTINKDMSNSYSKDILLHP